MSMRVFPNTRPNRELVSAALRKTAADVRAVFEKYARAPAGSALLKEGPPDPHVTLLAWRQPLLSRVIWLGDAGKIEALVENGADPMLDAIHLDSGAKEKSASPLEVALNASASRGEKEVPASLEIARKWLAEIMGNPGFLERVLSMDLADRAVIFGKLVLLEQSPELPSDLLAKTRLWIGKIKATVGPSERGGWWEALLPTYTVVEAFRQSPPLKGAEGYIKRILLKGSSGGLQTHEVLGRWEAIKQLSEKDQVEVLLGSPFSNRISRLPEKNQGDFLFMVLQREASAAVSILEEALASPVVGRAVRARWPDLLASIMSASVRPPVRAAVLALIPPGTDLAAMRFSYKKQASFPINRFYSEGSLLDILLDKSYNLRVADLEWVLAKGLRPEKKHLDALAGCMSYGSTTRKFKRLFLKWVAAGLEPTDETWEAIRLPADRAAIRSGWLENQLGGTQEPPSESAVRKPRF